MADPGVIPEGVEEHRMPSGSVVWYRDSDHQYSTTSEFKKANRVPGISTIAKNDGAPGADGLMDWAARLTCEGVAREAAASFDAEYPSPDWLRDGAAIHGVLREGGATWRHIRDQAGDRGTASHNVLQSLAEGVMPALSGGHDHAVADWWRKRRPDPVYVEKVVYDAERGFAGRFDLMYGEQEPTLLDLKTGSVRNAAMVQMNLYALGCRSAGLTPPSRLLILDTRDNGSWYELEVPIKPQWATAALQLYRFGSEMRRALTAAKKSSAGGVAEIPQELAA